MWSGQAGQAVSQPGDVGVPQEPPDVGAVAGGGRAADPGQLAERLRGGDRVVGPAVAHDRADRDCDLGPDVLAELADLVLGRGVTAQPVPGHPAHLAQSFEHVAIEHLLAVRSAEALDVTVLQRFAGLD